MEGDIDRAIIDCYQGLLSLFELTENAAVMTAFLEVMDPGFTPSTVRMTDVDKYSH